MSTDPVSYWDATAGVSETWPDSHQRIVLDETDSTMDEARRRAAALTGPTWIMARHQSAAHGRRGRAWSNPKGNFAATLLFRPEGGPAEAALRSFLAANALYDALARFVPSQKLALKWPNDVLLGGRKVAGILLESSGAGGTLDWLAVGIGVNLVAAPDVGDLEPGAVSPVALSEVAGTVPGQDEFLLWLAHHFDAQERLFRNVGFDAVRRLWLSRAARIGEVVTARTMSDETTGTFETVDEAGNLVLSTAKGRQTIAAGDVYF